MAYVDQKQNRTVAIGSVALIHVGLGAALLTGLAVKFDRPPPTTFEGRNIPIEQPPEPVPPPPEPRDVVTPREPVAPPVNVPIVIVPTRSEVDLTTTTEFFPPVPPAPIRLDPPPPAPPARAVDLSQGARIRGSQGDWFPQDSYPAMARRAGAEGRVGVSVDVGAGGRVTACRIVLSSGNEALDAATCRLATRNGRFEPARDAAGEPKAATVTLRPVRWRLEE